MIDSAFRARNHTLQLLANRSDELTVLYESSHGDDFASAFELKLFEQAVALVNLEMEVDAGLSKEVHAFFKVANGTLTLTPIQLFFAIYSQRMVDAPKWMLCSLIGALEHLGWADNAHSLRACLADQTPKWTDIVEKTVSEFDGAQCEPRILRMIPARDITWSQFSMSPRLQVAFWLALQDMHYADIDRAVASFVQRDEQLRAVEFAGQISRVRQALAELRRPPNRDVWRAVDTIQKMLPAERDPQGPASFVKRNLCRVPTGQEQDVGMSIDYFTALDTIDNYICEGLREEHDPPLESLCARAETMAQEATPRSPVSVLLANREVAAWLKATGLNKVVASRIEQSRDATSESNYWLLLEPVTPSVAFGDSWSAFSDRYRQERHGEYLEEKILHVAASALNVDATHVAVYLDNMCNDRRARILSNGEPYVTGLRCTELAETVVELPIDLSTLLKNTVGPSTGEVCSRPALGDVVLFLSRYFGRLGGKFVEKRRVESRAFLGGDVKFSVKDLRGKIVVPYSYWESLEGDVQLFPIDQKAYRLSIQSVFGTWAAGGKPPPAPWNPMETTYSTQLQDFVDQAGSALRSNFCK